MQAYLARIAAYDRAGPRLNAVREVNPDALAIAARVGRDATRRNAGRSRAFRSSSRTTSRPPTRSTRPPARWRCEGAKAKADATVVKLLRQAGAVILGKANLTEFANILAIDMPAGYSSLGGQVKNPYAPELDDKGVPIVPPGGSSSGSAVAVAAGLAAAAIGTETSGSLLSPASQNGVVTVKPTVGLISRAGIVPIAHSQDTAGPLTRTVRDAAILLNVLAAADPLDPATAELQRPADYTSALDRDGLKGARIGVPSDPSDPANDFYYGPLPPRAAAVMREAIAVLEAKARRSCAPTSRPRAGSAARAPRWRSSTATRRARRKNQPARRPIVFVYELKHDLNLYLRDWAAGTGDAQASPTSSRSMPPHADRALRFGQDIFLAAEATRGDLSELEYLSARQMDLRASRTLGLDAYMDEHRLDAVLFPGRDRRRDRRQGRLSQRPGARRLCCRDPRQGHPGLPLRRHLHRPRLERADPVAPRLCLRAGNPSPPPASRPAASRPGLPAVANLRRDTAPRFKPMYSSDCCSIMPSPADAVRAGGGMRPQRFRDRTDAGRQLAEKLAAYADRPDVLVLALPRGGVPVGYEVALARSARRSMFFSCASSASPDTRSWRWVRSQPAASAF